jgi:sulfate/thiosulfate transport system permease protein
MHVNSVRTQKTAGKMVANEPLWFRILLISLCYLIASVLIIVPLIYVFVQAFADGISGWWKNLFNDAETRHSVFLTLIVVPLAVLVNTVCGVAAAWTLTKFKFPGRTLLMTALDLPFAVSPVVAGLMFVLLYNLRTGYFAPLLNAIGLKVIFAWPGLVMATMFVTIPFVARELIPLMQALGDDEELAAVSLGASPWQIFWRVTLPNIKWGLLFGVIQCNARAIGEFGAVYVVSGRIERETYTMALRVEKLFQDYNNPGSYAVASVLTLMALSTLVLKIILERMVAASMEQSSSE